MFLFYFGNGLLIIIYYRRKVYCIFRIRMFLMFLSMKSYDVGFVFFGGIVFLFYLDNWIKRIRGKNINLGLKLS